MLVVCNGNVKSGSTWLVLLVRAAGRWAPIPDRFRNPAWANPSVAIEQFDSFVAARPWEARDMYCKQHWRGEARFHELARRPGVHVLTSTRDLRDVLVSRFYHDTHRGDTQEPDINSWYLRRGGRAKMRDFIAYHQFWQRAPEGARVHLVSYEGLQTDFDVEARRMFEFLGWTLDDAALSALRSQTDFRNVRKDGNSTFMRKGQVGDWQNHLTPKVLQDLQALAAEHAFAWPDGLER